MQLSDNSPIASSFSLSTDTASTNNTDITELIKGGTVVEPMHIN